MRASGGPADEFLDEQAARDWLAERANPDEQSLSSLRAPVDFFVAARRMSVGDALPMLLRSLEDHGRLRRSATTRRHIGVWHADSVRALLTVVALRPLGLRLAAIALAGGAGALAELPLGQSLLLMTAALLVRWYTPLAVLATVAAVPFRPEDWWLCLLTLMTCWYLQTVANLRWSVLSTAWWARGPVLGVLPVGAVLALAARRRWTLFSTAVDLATGGQGDTAVPFLARLGDVPRDCEPVLGMARALAAMDHGDISGALTRAGAATEAARSAKPAVRGWCQAQLARLLSTNGREEEAAALRAEAMGLLRGRRSRRHLRQLLLEQIESQVTVQPLHVALRDVHRMRRMAVRAHDHNMLHQTEMWLVELMLRVGNHSGAAWTLREIVHADDARVAWHRTPQQMANERLVHASVLVEDAKSRQQARDDANAALAIVDAARRPLAAVGARLLLARAEELDGNQTEALAEAAHALATVHSARYLIPSARGRQQWERMQLSAYAIILRLAAGTKDSALVAEVLETARGEVLPDHLDQQDLTAHLALDAISAAPAGVADASSEGPGDPDAGDNEAVLAYVGTSPVRRPPPVSVAGRQRLPGDTSHLGEIDLDRELCALAGRCWYWSAVTVLDRYYWVLRDPTGTWSHGSVDFGEGSAAAIAESDLRSALPLPQDGEEPSDVSGRVDAGALSAARGTTAERELLGRVAEQFLPPPLAEGLRLATGPDPVSVVVSLPGSLAHLPVAVLPLGPRSDRRLVEAARVMHVPAWAVLSQCRKRPRESPRRARPLRLAVVAPDGARATVTRLNPPPGASRFLRGPVTKTELSKVLGLLSDERDWLLYLAGHVDSAPGNATRSGLRMADPTADNGVGRLSMADVLPTSDGTTEFPLPDRVLALACSSLGLEADPGALNVRTPTSEWLGFGSALMLAGADHVLCTLYPVYPVSQLNNAAHLLAEKLVTGGSPADALRAVQLDELTRWRQTGKGRPFLWQAFAYVGLGI